jgi:hypothetical protein
LNRRGALFDESFSSLDEQLQLARYRIVLGHLADRVRAARPGNRGRVDRIGLASSAREGTGTGHQVRRNANDTLTRVDQLLLESARDVADIFDTPRQIRPESGQRPPQRGRVANRRGRYGLLAQFASAAVDRNARVRLLMRVNADNNHDPSLPRVALSAMHTTVRTWRRHGPA